MAAAVHSERLPQRHLLRESFAAIRTRAKRRAEK
jgi:hypothetical protein